MMQASVEASGTHMLSQPPGVVIKLDGRRSPRSQFLSVQSGGSFASSVVESLVRPHVPEVNEWADLREDQMINPAPGVLPSFGPLGPREPWDGLRLGN